MWRPGVPAIVLSLGWVVACGGRYERGAPTSGDADPVASMGGRSGAGGGTNGGVASGSGGGSGGQVAVAGSSMVAELCLSQHADYVEYRAQVMAEFSSFPCMADADCLAFFDQSACDPSCVRLATAARRGVVDRLNNFETSGCAQECSPQPWLACPRATPSRCVSGRCQ